jgi:hypothetical protein
MSTAGLIGFSFSCLLLILGTLFYTDHSSRMIEQQNQQIERMIDLKEQAHPTYKYEA